jgi:hypothetical protein
MTRKEVRLALRHFEDRGAYSLRLFLDNRTTVLAHQWSLEEGESWNGDRQEAGQDDTNDDGAAGPDDTEGLLRVVARGRQALIAISSIVGIEMVPFGW